MANRLSPYALVADDDLLVRMDAVTTLEDAELLTYGASNIDEALFIFENAV